MSQAWRKTREYRLWKVAVVRRDRKCLICGSMHKRHAHHLNSASYYPFLRFDVDNGVTLCSKCHMHLHCDYKKSYRSKCDRNDYENYKKLAEYFLGIGGKHE
jgi:hypothetical protein